MALTDVRRRGAPPATSPSPGHSFRPASRRRTRLAAGAALAALAIGGNLLLYSGMDQRTAVLQVVRDVPAGAQVVADDLREVEVAADATVRTVTADRADSVIGSYARVRMVSGSLVVVESTQSAPLVSPGSAIVAIQVPDGALPIGLRERSHVNLVLPPTRTVDAGEPAVVSGRVVGLPSSPQSVSGRVSLSVEVAVDVAPMVVANDDVRVVLLEPGVDAASTATEPGS